MRPCAPAGLGTIWTRLVLPNKKPRDLSESELVENQQKVLERGLEPPQVTLLDP